MRCCLLFVNEQLSLFLWTSPLKASWCLLSAFSLKESQSLALIVFPLSSHCIFSTFGLVIILSCTILLLKPQPNFSLELMQHFSAASEVFLRFPSALVQKIAFPLDLVLSNASFVPVIQDFLDFVLSVSHLVLSVDRYILLNKRLYGDIDIVSTLVLVLLHCDIVKLYINLIPTAMIVLVCFLIFYSAQASVSTQIPIIPMMIFQSQIQDYSISRQMVRRGKEMFAPKFDKQFYVRHWELHMHNQVKEAISPGRSQQPSSFNKFISPEMPDFKTDNRQLYGYGILLVFALLVVLQREAKEKQRQVSFEEEEYELAGAKH